jgi:hypothetical protein
LPGKVPVKHSLIFVNINAQVPKNSGRRIETKYKVPNLPSKSSNDVQNQIARVRSKHSPSSSRITDTHLIKANVEGNALDTVSGQGLIVGQILTFGIAANDTVDGQSNTELSLATNPAAVLVLGLPLDI